MNVEQIAADLFGKMAGHIAKQLAPIVERLAAVEARQPEKGEKGDQGEPGQMGEPGEAGPAGPQGEPGPPGRDGVAGEKGDPGDMGPAGPEGPRGIEGAAGRDGRDGLTGPQGEKGMDGRDGIDGKDGLGFDDLSMQFDGERGFSVKFVMGDQVKSFDFSLPVPIYRGVFKDGTYSKFDTVTWGGSVWIAQKDTENRPGGNEDWQLMVKQGGEGKSAFAIAQERGFTGTKQEWVNSLYPVGEAIVKVRP